MQKPKLASIFAGIGGIELGFEKAGFETVFQCEILPAARAVLKEHFQGEIRTDIRSLKHLPTVDVITAGFPCQDLSQAGMAHGISGKNSSIVNHLFDLLEKKRKFPDWLVLENVPFMLQLQKGRAMRHLTKRIEALNMSWAYRIVDTRAFGLPQRRRRVVLVASRDYDPKEVLFADESRVQIDFTVPSEAYGFYWTEGNTGLGWTADGVPTLKGGSGLGIPSPPGIWFVDCDSIVTPDIRDAERLQGFPANWTEPAASESNRKGERWKLIGNAVAVPISKWIAGRLANPSNKRIDCDSKELDGTTWPNAAFGVNGKAFAVDISEWPKCYSYQSLSDFIKYPTSPLSYRATKGFYGRLSKSSLNRPEEFDLALQSHLSSFSPA